MAPSMVRPDNFYVVHGWMMTNLGLKGSELKLYAIIYGFTQTGGQEFTGSLQYLVDWAGLTKANVLKNLQSLVDKGLLIKNDVYIDGKKRCKYRCDLDKNGGIKSIPGQYQNNTDAGIKSIPKPVSKQYPAGIETIPNNIEDNIADNTADNIGDNIPHTPKGVDAQERRFNEFWDLYPKKVGKEAARKAWKKVKPDAELHERILAAIDAAKVSDQWKREGGRFIPNPATWLNQGRWDDEPMPAAQPGYQAPINQAMPAHSSNPFLEALKGGFV